MSTEIATQTPPPTQAEGLLPSGDPNTTKSKPKNRKTRWTRNGVIVDRSAPRTIRLGGFMLSEAQTMQWACRLDPTVPNDPRYIFLAIDEIKKHVRPLRANFTMIGEDDEPDFMLITQGPGYFPQGYRGYNPKRIPQYAERDIEARARQLLKEQGMENLEYRTMLTDLDPDL